MALPASGQLSFSQINVELGNISTSPASMLAMATAAGKSTSNASVSNFYGYSAGSTVHYGYSPSIVTLANTTSDQDYYRSLVITGRMPGQIYRFNFHVLFVELVGPILASVYYSLNSTSTWIEIASYATSEIDQISILGIDYDDVVRVRIQTTTKIPTEAEGEIILGLAGGLVTTGVGVVTSDEDEWQAGFNMS